MIVRYSARFRVGQSAGFYNMDVHQVPLSGDLYFKVRSMMVRDVYLDYASTRELIFGNWRVLFK